MSMSAKELSASPYGETVSFCEPYAHTNRCASESQSEVRIWKRVKSLQHIYTPRTGHTMVMHGDCIYAFGGTDRNGRQQDLYRFDIVTSCWHRVNACGSIPSARSGAAAIVDDNRMYLFGGYDGRDGNYFNDLYYYDFVQNTWSQVNQLSYLLPAPRIDHGCFLRQHVIYVFGGYNGCTRFNDLYALNLHTGRWHAIKTTEGYSDDEVFPSRRFGHTIIYHERNDRLILFGGWDGHMTLNDVYSYDFISNKWVKVCAQGDIPADRYRHSAVVQGDNMYVFGGVNKSHVRFNDVYELNLLTFVWTKLTAIGQLPSSRTFHRAVVHGTKMYVLGGYDGTERLSDLYSIDIGSVSPRCLVDLCAMQIRQEAHVRFDWRNLPPHMINSVVFYRDKYGFLRGKCEECREDCCVIDGEITVGKNNDCSCGHSMDCHTILLESGFSSSSLSTKGQAQMSSFCSSFCKRILERHFRRKGDMLVTRDISWRG